MYFYTENVCCGTVNSLYLTENDIIWSGHVYDDLASSTVYMRYYSAQQKKKYTAKTTLSGINNDTVILDFNVK